MPYFPQFGGTNGVPELNAGQEGSPRRGGLVWYMVNVISSEPQVDEVKHGVPQQNIAFQDRLGWRGEIVTWSGGAKFKDSSELADLRSELSLYRTGSTISDVDGSRSAVNKDYFKPTVLKDYFGEFMASEAIMVGYQFEGRIRGISSSASYTLWQQLSIVFQILG